MLGEAVLELVAELRHVGLENIAARFLQSDLAIGGKHVIMPVVGERGSQRGRIFRR